jgi:HrpA-like RNA helicase
MGGDSTLAAVTHILLDEIHERNCFLDFLLIALRDSLAKFRSLRLVLMSATVDTELFTKYFNNCPVFLGSVYVMFIVIHFVCNLCQ